MTVLWNVCYNSTVLYKANFVLKIILNSALKLIFFSYSGLHHRVLSHSLPYLPRLPHLQEKVRQRE